MRLKSGTRLRHLIGIMETCISAGSRTLDWGAGEVCSVPDSATDFLYDTGPVTYASSLKLPQGLGIHISPSRFPSYKMSVIILFPPPSFPPIFLPHLICVLQGKDSLVLCALTSD